jgi:hypothetical protein
MILYKLLVFFTLFGCSSYKTPSTLEIDKRVLPIVEKFALLYNKPLPDNLRVIFSDLDNEDRGGLCYNHRRLVILNTQNWDENTEITKEMIVFHELGHCVLDRNHILYDKRQKCSPSIMGNSGVSDDCYVDRYEYYIKELFSE